MTEELQLELHHDRILVEMEPPKHATPSGIALPENSKTVEQSPFLTGRVLAVGPGNWLAEMGRDAISADMAPIRTQMDVKVGDRVVFHHRSAHDRLFINGKALLLMGNRDICMTVGDDVQISQFRTGYAGLSV